MSKINQEIEAFASKLEKASTDPREQLFTVIKSLGPEGLKARLPNLNDEERIVLKSALEEMNLQKAVSFDKEAQAAKVIQGKVTDTIIQEEIASDDADEKLVKPEAAKMNHQGTPTDGWQGQVIKSVNESDELTEKVVHTLLEKGMSEETVVQKCMQKGMDGKKVQGAVEKFKGKGKDKPKDGTDEMEKAGKMSKDAAKDAIMGMEEKEHGTKDPKKLVDAEKKEHADKKKDVKKSLTWEDDSRLLKANTQGRNFHFNVEQFINDHQVEPTAEVQKSGDSQFENLNDLIAKSEDRTWDQISTETGLKSNAEKINGTLQKSFDDVKDVAALMNISEEEARQILGI